MKSIEELRQFFELNIKPNLDGLETKRIKAKRKKIIFHFLFGISILAIFSNFVFLIVKSPDKNHDIPAFWVFISQIFLLPFFLGLCIAWWNFFRKRADFRHEFKEALISPIVKFVEPELKYSPEDRIVPGVLFLGSEIFPHSSYYPPGFWAEDFVEGELGRTKFEFFEINCSSPRAIYSRYSDWRNHLYKGVIPIDLKSDADIPERISFRGLFFVAEFNKSFKGCTLIRPDDLGIRPQWLAATGREPVRLEDIEFEKHFAVYSTDQITARYILSTSLMKRITEYKIKVGRAIRISFIRNKIFIAIGNKKNSFEINLFKSLYDFDKIKEYYNDFRIALDIIDDLNLNTRIWLKTDENQVAEMPRLSNYPFKKRLIYILLATILGFYGLHNFYTGYKIRGAIKLLITLGSMLLGSYGFYAVLLVWLWAIIEIFTFTVDSKGNPLK
ncbi:MAG: hypothetical protein A2W19_14855 [Spirochaetes bacterium RBG_16_49_21]|nr:MAG: hypothetical protein A2W19_14855 [Spirochaetes bacterium RBG_16_49_21]